MNKITTFTICILVALISRAQAPDVPAETGSTFGKAITAENAIPVEQLITIMNSKKDQKKMEVKLKGIVTDVCEAMGCWLTLKSSDGNMMVKMKDHSFFVPLALEGKEIVIDGVAEEKTTSVEQLKHYAKDAGKPESEIAKITEPKREIVVSAKGILVL